LELFKIGFKDIGVLDVVDIILVGVILFQLYKLLRGSLAFNIFIGLLLVYVAWLLVKALNMQLLSTILGQFIGVGVIAVIIVFQPEIRRFLLLLGRGKVWNRSNRWKNLFSLNLNIRTDSKQLAKELSEACNNLSRGKTGALIVIAETSKLQFFVDTGTAINSHITGELIESIFQKKGPIHDGAIIIADNKILAAKCILPVSENPDLPKTIGTRHRAAVGITENSDALAIIVSEDRKQLAYAEEGKLYMNISKEKLENVLTKALSFM